MPVTEAWGGGQQQAGLWSSLASQARRINEVRGKMIKTPCVVTLADDLWLPHMFSHSAYMCVCACTHTRFASGGGDHGDDLVGKVFVSQAWDLSSDLTQKARPTYTQL